MSIKNKKGNSRFQLVKIDKFDENEMTESEFLEKDTFKENDISKEEKVEVSKEDKNSDIAFADIKEDAEEKNLDKSVSKRPYISFEVRVVMAIVFILIFFALACYLILEAINFGESENIHYDEVSSLSYEVCAKGENAPCYGEEAYYNSNDIGTVKTNLNYGLKFSKELAYDFDYYIVLNMKAVDSGGTVLYDVDETLVEKKRQKGTSDQIKVSEDIIIDYIKYNDGASLYTKNREGAKALLSLKLFIADGKEKRAVTTMEIPLQQNDFKINVDNTEHSDFVKINHNEWNTYNSICAGIASLLIIISLLLVYRVTKFVLKVTMNRTEYQTLVNDILRDYDRIIVIARDGYESNIAKQMIEVDSFDDLLAARDVLEKPIIFSRINDVKCEFIVEDDEKLFKYILKESDVIGG